LDSEKSRWRSKYPRGNHPPETSVISGFRGALATSYPLGLALAPQLEDRFAGGHGCAQPRESYIVDFKMTAHFSRFAFTFRYWRTIADSAD
jgi:hypothetical protein